VKLVKEQELKLPVLEQVSMGWVETGTKEVSGEGEGVDEHYDVKKLVEKKLKN
jgi:hypothetical protein